MKSNFRMAESKIGMHEMHGHNKIALPLCAGDAILRINDKRSPVAKQQILKEGMEA
jgi:hypothetical protein